MARRIWRFFLHVSANTTMEFFTLKGLQAISPGSRMALNLFEVGGVHRETRLPGQVLTYFVCCRVRSISASLPYWSVSTNNAR